MLLKEARVAKGWGIREFAEKLFPLIPNMRSKTSVVSFASLISRWESGDRTVTLKYRGAIQSLLGEGIEFDDRSKSNGNTATEFLSKKLGLTEEEIASVMENPLLQKAAGRSIKQMLNKLRTALDA